MNNLTFKEWSILSDLETIAPLGEDFEFSMARGELKTAQNAVKRLMTKLKGEGDLEAWVQSKITKAAEYLDTVADHLSHGEDDTVRTLEVKEAVLGRYKEDKGGGKTLRSASERLKPKSKKSEEKSEPEGPKVTRLKTRGPRKGEATASQVQGWRGSDRTNTNRRGQSDPQAKLAMREGFKGHKSVEEIAKKHKVSPSIIQKQLEMGMKVEHEHTTDNDAAMDIALQHLDEIPNYYSKLKKVEKVKEDIEILDANGNTFAHVVDVIKGSDYKFKSFTQPITEDAVSELESQLKKLNNTSYDSIDKLMRNIMKEHDMTAKELHSAFIKKHDKTPDDWIKGLNEKCWDGYKQVGMKKKGKRVVPNCVKEEGLRDWFGKSKSKDGKSGWVNVVTGGTCASDEPGEGTPKCVSSAKRASMSDAERKSAARRKKAADPGQQSKSGAAKPTYVPTDSPKKKMNENHQAIAAGKEKDEEGYMANTEMDTIDSAVKKLRKIIKKGDSQLPAWVQSKITKAADYIDTAADYLDSNEMSEVSEEADKKTKGSGTKDACYPKVKSRYSVWPSAYASGALVKCRKVGAANWGNKSESIDLKSKDPLSESQGMIRFCPKCKKTETRNECKYGPKYWDMFSIQPSLASDAYDPTEIHPANEQVSFDIGPDHNSVKKTAKIRNLATKTTNPNEKSVALKKLSGPSLPLADSIIHPGQLTTEDYQRIQSTGNVYTILFSWRGRPMMNLQLFFPNMKRPSKQEVTSQVEKLYPGAVVFQWRPSVTDPTKPIIVIQN